jgi:hypothetical protein
MPRPNAGPRLFINEKRGGFYYIAWTKDGRSRVRSTGTKDRREADKILGEFLIARAEKDGPSCPNQTFVMEILADYAETKADSPAASRIGYAIAALSPFWKEKTVAEVHEGTCRQYAKHRGKSAGTIRRELTVLRSAINFAVRTNQLTRGADVALPDKPEPRDVLVDAV